MSADARVLVLDDEEQFHKSRSFWMDAVRYFRRDRLSMLALAVLLLLTLACFFGPPIVEKVLHVDVPDRPDPPQPAAGEPACWAPTSSAAIISSGCCTGGRSRCGRLSRQPGSAITIGVVVGIVTLFMAVWGRRRDVVHQHPGIRADDLPAADRGHDLVALGQC
jgi:hypothetical protein